MFGLILKVFIAVARIYYSGAYILLRLQTKEISSGYITQSMPRLGPWCKRFHLGPFECCLSPRLGQDALLPSTIRETLTVNWSFPHGHGQAWFHGQKSGFSCPRGPVSALGPWNCSKAEVLCFQRSPAQLGLCPFRPLRQE